MTSSSNAILIAFVQQMDFRSDRFIPYSWHRTKPGNWLTTWETMAKESLRGAQSREMGSSLGSPGEKLEKPGRQPVMVGDE